MVAFLSFHCAEGLVCGDKKYILLIPHLKCILEVMIYLMDKYFIILFIISYILNIVYFFSLSYSNLFCFQKIFYQIIRKIYKFENI